MPETLTLNTPSTTGEWEPTIIDSKIVFIRIDYDEGPHDYPFEDDSWGYIVHHARRIDKGFNPDEFTRRLEQDKDAVVLAAYNHGSWLWWPKADAATSARVPDMQWDGNWRAGLFVPGKELRAHCNAKHWKLGSPERTQYLLEAAQRAAKMFTHWLNGEYYGYQVAVYDLKVEGEPVTDYDEYDGDEEYDSCWGFDDSDFCLEQAKESALALLK